VAKFLKYYLIPKTDLCKYLELRFNIAGSNRYNKYFDDFEVNVYEGKLKQILTFVYRISNDYNTITTQLGDDFQFMRDSLVRSGELKPPLTYDSKYSEMLLDGIKEWNGKEFVKYQNR
jgi:hypothetical protein